MRAEVEHRLPIGAAEETGTIVVGAAADGPGGVRVWALRPGGQGEVAASARAMVLSGSTA